MLRRLLRHTGRFEFAVASPAGVRLGFVFMMGVRAAQEGHFIEDVFLEPFDLEPQRRVTETFTTRSDVHGQYHFTGLAPGKYRALSSFEYQTADSSTMSSAAARQVRVESAVDLQLDLDLYEIP